MIDLKRSSSGILVRGVFWMAVLAFAPCAFAQEDASDEEIQECAQAYEQAQVKRNAGELKAAQEQLRICVRDLCPDFVRTDCGQWLSDVTAEIPSVIFAAQDGSRKDLIDVQVTVDGEVVAKSLDGRAVELDPGQHKVVFEYAGKQVEQNLLVSQGEKNRVIRVVIKLPVDSDGDGLLDENDTCPKQEGPAENDGCPEKEQATPAAPASGTNWMRMGAYAGWGVGAAGMAVFAIYGLDGLKMSDEANAKCQPDEDNMLPCSDEEKERLISEVDDTYLVANIGLGVGIAGIAAGTVLFFMSQGDEQSEETAEPAPEETMRIDVAPTPGGGFFSLRGTF